MTEQTPKRNLPATAPPSDKLPDEPRKLDQAYKTAHNVSKVLISLPLSTHKLISHQGIRPTIQSRPHRRASSQPPASRPASCHLRLELRRRLKGKRRIRCCFIRLFHRICFGYWSPWAFHYRHGRYECREDGQGWA